MFLKKAKQTFCVVTVHSEKSCGTQVFHSTGGAFEPLRDKKKGVHCLFSAFLIELFNICTN